MVKPESSDPIQRFAQLLRAEWGRLDARHQTELDTEDLLDMFWLARHISPAPSARTQPQASTPSTSTTQRRVDGMTPPPEGEPKVAVYPQPPETKQPSEAQPALGTGLRLQVPATNALRSQLDLARALRPLMRKIPSPTQRWLDEEATAVQIAEQQIWSQVLVPAPERWFDLAIVIEDSPSLKRWEDTLEELQTLVERQGAFRQIRTWRVRGQGGGAIELLPHGQASATAQRSCPAQALLDPTGRRMIWLVSDCTSELWDYPPIYAALEKWGKYSPLAIVQLLPERLWPGTALGMGQPMRLPAVTPGATHAILSAKATPIYPVVEEEAELTGPTVDSVQKKAPRRTLILPVISLEPEPLARWTKVTSGVGDTSFVGLQIDLSDLTPAAAPLPNDQTPEQRVRLFCATASITAQKLAGLMAAVPVSLPVVHLNQRYEPTGQAPAGISPQGAGNEPKEIQRNLLPQSRQVHVAEVFMGGLLDAVPPPPDRPDQPTQYRFAELVRQMLIDAVPISKTTKVLDVVSVDISQRLGLGTKSFAALLASLPELDVEGQQTIQLQ